MAEAISKRVEAAPTRGNGNFPGLFWHSVLGAAILGMFATAAVAAPLNSAHPAETQISRQIAPEPPEPGGTFQIAQTRAKTTRDVERERAAKKKREQRKTRKRRASRKSRAVAVNAPPPVRKPETGNPAGGPGVSLAAALVAGGPALTSGVVWTAEPLSGKAPPTVTTDPQPTLLLPTGQYRITAKLNDFLQSVEVDIPASGIARLDLAFNAARLRIRVLPAQGAMPLEAARLRILKIGVDGAPPVADTNVATFDDVLPAGIYRIEAALGLARAVKDIGLTAGADRTVELNLSVGYMRLRARAAPGQTPLPNVVFELLPADGLEAAPRPLATKSGASAVFTVPGGTYRVRARYGEASSRQLVDVAPNTFSDIIMDLEAGQAVVTLTDVPEGADNGIAFRLVRHDGDEGPSLVLSRSGTKLDVGLPAGSYTVIAELEDGRQAEQSFIVEPGVRTAIALAPPAQPPARLTMTAGIVGGGALPDGERDRDIVYRASTPGQPEPVASGNLSENSSVTLPGGTYEISATHRATGAKASATVTVKAGAATDMRLEFPLGIASLVLAEDRRGNSDAGEQVGSHGSDAEWVLTGIDGKQVARHEGPAADITLKPGEYVVTLTIAGTANTAALSIAAGKNTPVSLPVK